MASTSRRSGSKKTVQPNRLKPLTSKEKCPPTVGLTEEIECKVILQKLSNKYKHKLEQLKENNPPSPPTVQLIEPDSPSPTKIAKLVENESGDENEPQENTIMNITAGLQEKNSHMEEAPSEHNLRQRVNTRGTRRKLMDKQAVPAVPSIDTQLVQNPGTAPTNRRKAPSPCTSPEEKIPRTRRKVPSPCTSDDSELVQNTICSSTETSPSKDSTTSDNSSSKSSSESRSSIFDFDEPQESPSLTLRDDCELGEETTSIGSELVDSQSQSPTSSSRIKPEYIKALQSKTPVLKHKKKKGAVRRKKTEDKKSAEEEWLEKMKNEFAEVDKFDLIVL